MTDITFEGIVPFTLDGVSLTMKMDYVPKKGPNIGKNMGCVIFINKATPTVKQVFATVKEALAANEANAPEGARVYANGSYIPFAKAMEMELTGYKYKKADVPEPYENSLTFWTVEAAKKKNAKGKTTVKRAVDPTAGPLPGM